MNRPSLTIALAAMLQTVVTGCGRPPAGMNSPYRGAPSGLHSAGWERSTPDPAAGIDYGRAALAGSGDFAILLWTDLGSGGAGMSMNSEPRRLDVTGRFESSDLKSPIGFHCQKDGPSRGSATIDGVKYDLAGGSLFLVSTRGEQPIVRQLDCDISRIEFDDYESDLKTLAEDHPEISAFFRDPTSKE